LRPSYCGNPEAFSRCFLHSLTLAHFSIPAISKCHTLPKQTKTQSSNLMHFHKNAGIHNMPQNLSSKPSE
jgi:hypothetical protein